MKIGLIVTLGFTLLFYGCGTVTPSTPVVFNTFNTSSTKAPTKQKSTATYPGSTQQNVPTPKTPTTPLSTPPMQPEAKSPSIDSTISSTEITSRPVETVQLPATPLVEEPMVTSTMPEVLPPAALSHNGEMIKIAVLIPQKTIKKYAITSVNTVISYLLYKNYSFDLNVFNSSDEKEESIVKALADIKAGGYTYIIAPVTPEGANIICAKVTDTMVYIPTLHSTSVSNAGQNIFFGGIDYDQQIALLNGFANEKVGAFDDGSGLSSQLGLLVKKYNGRVFYEKRVENSKSDFKQMFKGHTSLNSASFYLNTPLVTSSLIASQLRANSIYPHALLSTQINYNPLLLTLTQFEDRNDMFIANSIQRTPAKLEEINTLFGHDIVYDWVNYSTSIGADLLSTHFFNTPSQKTFKEAIVNRQVIYNTSIVKPERHAFVKVEQP